MQVLSVEIHMRISLAFLICLLSLTLEASQRAVTDEGEIVILNDDGTWVFESPENVVSSKIPTSTEEFKRLSESSFRLKSTTNDSEIWIDPKKWSFKKGQTNEAAEYEFQFKGRSWQTRACDSTCRIAWRHRASGP